MPPVKTAFKITEINSASYKYLSSGLLASASMQHSGKATLLQAGAVPVLSYTKVLNRLHNRNSLCVYSYTKPE